ncbi:MAG: LruC domain-containing protein [Bacteroidia bacterium]|nr:LruC domain-containing protein [Bacteroidia bacterium]
MNRITILCLLLIIFACKKDNVSAVKPVINPNPDFATQMKIPSGFNFENARTVNLELTILNSNDQPGKNICVIISDNPLDQNGKVFLKGKTDGNGIFKATVSIAKTINQLICNTTMLGIPQDIVISNLSQTVSITFGGRNPHWVQTIGNLLPANHFTAYKKGAEKFSYRLLTGWNANGVPNNLQQPRDVVSNQLINDIWSSLPSRVSVAVNHPEWLDDNLSKRTLLITQTADVYVTFLTEGAGYRNSLFYYKYHKNFPPSSSAAIDSLYIIYPNASLLNSNGGLLTGDRVLLGRIGADTVIAYGIAANGFNNTNATINGGDWIFYANKNFNPETNPTLKQHLVMLYDAPSKKFIMGFEDLIRTASGCDHDFNDVLFYTSCNPVNAISHDSIINLPASNDTDGDGVNDVDDEYPADNLRAFNNYYPAKNAKATVAFEDLWPYYGDYDMNDVVVDYNYKIITNAQNAVKEVNGLFTLRASGGQIKNAFAVQFPTNAANVSMLTGATQEGGQSTAVIKIINDIRTVQNRWNTLTTEPWADTVNYAVAFTLNSPVAISTFGLNEYNPFIWGNSDGKSRAYEIHLPGKLPTALADENLLGQGDDRTSRSNNKYYLSKDNLPWAINIPDRFDYPIEKSDIVTAHLKFAQWAQSGGGVYNDWYKNINGYRNSLKIYAKP